MITCQSGPIADRLRDWRGFRNGLSYIENCERPRLVANYFAQAPFGSRTLDFYTPETWPTPWEILHNESYCLSSLSLLMYYTLVMSEEYTDDIELWLIDDSEDRYLVPVIANQNILNYELGQISTVQDLSKQIKVIEKFGKNIVPQYA